MWKIHGKFYDLENFLNRHPGGRTILESSKNGIDCTASFESYHAMCDKNLINSIMKKYEVDCTENEPEQLFMFKEQDFYDILTKRVKRYFLFNNLSHHYNSFWIKKALIQVSLYLVSFLLFCYCKGIGLILRMILAFFSGHMFIQYGFSVMHEASHCAISPDHKHNEALSKTWNSLALWDHQLWNKHHCYRHHSFTGTKYDPDTLHFLPIVRKSLHENANKYFKNIGCTKTLVLFFTCVFPGLWFGQVLAYCNWIYRKRLWRVKIIYCDVIDVLF